MVGLFVSRSEQKAYDASIKQPECSYLLSSYIAPTASFIIF